LEASVFALSPVSDGMVLAGTDLAPTWIYASFNNGVSFSPYSEGLADRASVEAFAVNETYMFAGTDQHGVWRRVRPGVVSAEVNQNIPQDFHLSQNFPNPFNPSTKIRYSIPQSSGVVIKVFDMLGKEIATLVNEEKPIGTYTIEFNATNLPSGIYFYQLQAPNFTQTKKMILLK
jgi:hypothetical protein